MSLDTQVVAGHARFWWQQFRFHARFHSTQ